MTFDKITKAKEHFQYGINCDIFSEPVTSYAKTAVEALEKQIPRKPVGEVTTSPVKIGNGVFKEGTTIHHCPNCSGLIPRIYKYCGHCGQALEWGDGNV